MSSKQQDEQSERIQPLGLPTAAMPEAGPTIKKYYERKHQTERGKFYPLHLTLTWDRDR